MTSFRSRCQVVSTELFPPVVVVPSAKIQLPSLGRKHYRHNMPLMHPQALDGSIAVESASKDIQCDLKKGCSYSGCEFFSSTDI